MLKQKLRQYVKRRGYLPSMPLKRCIVKLKYSFQGPIQTDENYMPLLTLCVTLQIRHFCQNSVTSFAKTSKKKNYLSNIFLRGSLVKSIYFFQGLLKTNESNIFICRFFYQKVFPVKQLPRFFRCLEIVDAQDDPLNFFTYRIFEDRTFLYVLAVY